MKYSIAFLFSIFQRVVFFYQITIVPWILIVFWHMQTVHLNLLISHEYVLDIVWKYVSNWASIYHMVSVAGAFTNINPRWISSDTWPSKFLGALQHDDREKICWKNCCYDQKQQPQFFHICCFLLVFVVATNKCCQNVAQQ